MKWFRKEHEYLTLSRQAEPDIDLKEAAKEVEEQKRVALRQQGQLSTLKEKLIVTRRENNFSKHIFGEG